MSRTTRIWIVALASLVAGTAAVAAFPFTKSWHEPSTGSAGQNRAGAGGLYGTGGRTDKKIKCSHCHIKTPGTATGLIGMNLTSVPAFGTTTSGDAKYAPTVQYKITITMTGEHLRGTAPNNNKNSIAATIENANGQRAGRFISDAGQDSNACPAQNPYPGGGGPVSPAGKTTFMYGDCHGILPLDHPNLTAWTFDWVAPAAGAGDLNFYIGMVDGNTDGSSSLGDDTFERTVPLREGP